MVSVSMMTKLRGARAEKLNTEKQEESQDPLEALGNPGTFLAERSTSEVLKDHGVADASSLYAIKTQLKALKVPFTFAVA